MTYLLIMTLTPQKMNRKSNLQLNHQRQYCKITSLIKLYKVIEERLIKRLAYRIKLLLIMYKNQAYTLANRFQ